MIDPIIKKDLGYDPNIDDKTIMKLWKTRIKLVCKPCWELKYCPYGIIVEEFPALPITKEEGIEHHEYLKERLKKGLIDKKQKNSVRAMIKSFDPNDYPDELPPREIMDCYCTQFAHMCPVYYVREPFSETREGRRVNRKISRADTLKIVRRDNNQCQKCGKILKDDEIEIDHIIPSSLGGPSEIHNLQVTCLECNRKKSNKIEILDQD
jgi:hypothetical protein